MKPSSNRKYASQLLDSTATKVLLSNKTEESFSIFVSTWGGQLYFLKYEQNNKEIMKYKSFDYSDNRFNPILGLCAQQNKLYYSNNNEINQSVINEIDLHSMKVSSSTIGQHSKPINHLLSVDNDKLCSFSWDGTCKLWDVRSNKLIRTIELGGIPTSVKMFNQQIVGVIDSKEFFFMDELEVNEPQSFGTEKSFRPYIKSLDILDSQERVLDFVIGTFDGKIEHFHHKIYRNQNAVPGGVWKSHKAKCFERDIVFPVNSLYAFPKTTGFVISGGEDGAVQINSVSESRKVRTLLPDPLPVKHLECDDDLSFLVVSKGYGMHYDRKNIISQGQEKAKIIVLPFEESDFE